MTVEIREHPFDPWQIVSEYRSYSAAARIIGGKQKLSPVTGPFKGINKDSKEFVLIYLNKVEGSNK